MLRVEEITAGYGEYQVLFGVSFHVEEGETVSIVGANGAGKTTLLRTLSGLLPVTSGRVTFLGQEITRWPGKRIVDAGLSLVPEGRGLFPYMTVRENLELGAHLKRARMEKSRSLERVYELFPRLKGKEGQLAGTLSGGEQQMLAIGRGLMSHPKLLMLDEPSMGLSPLLVQRLFEIIRDIRRDGVTVLLVEQNLQSSLEISDRAYVIETGRVALEGTGAELLDNSFVKNAYLGV